MASSISSWSQSNGQISRQFARGEHRLTPWLLGLATLVLALVGAVPHAGGWNDGSRLAAVESLVDRHTLIIDDSVFCRPWLALVHGYSPYAPQDWELMETGTGDKVLIRGHFYSDKPAVISVLMATLYRTLRCLGLPQALKRPDLYCWILTVGTAGLAYVVAVLALYQLGKALGLSEKIRLIWIGSFGTSTFALTYTRHVNNHILLLAVVAMSCLQMVHLTRELESGGKPIWRFIALGTLIGLGYNLDSGSGPLLILVTLVLMIYRCRQAKPVAVFLLAAVPWVVAGLGVNYAISGVWRPMGMVPEYFAWPGSHFAPDSLTGHANLDPVKVPIYSVALLIGPHGLLNHNIPLLLVFPAVAVLRGRLWQNMDLVLWLGWCCGTWLVYAVLSNNYAGMCCSIRWFVPFLVPAYYLLALFLRERPDYVPDLVILSVWGCALAAIMWCHGPWISHRVPLLWPINGAALASWLFYRMRRESSLRLTAGWRLSAGES